MIHGVSPLRGQTEHGALTAGRPEVRGTRLACHGPITAVRSGRVRSIGNRGPGGLVPDVCGQLHRRARERKTLERNTPQRAKLEQRDPDVRRGRSVNIYIPPEPIARAKKRHASLLTKRTYMASAGATPADSFPLSFAIR